MNDRFEVTGPHVPLHAVCMDYYAVRLKDPSLEVCQVKIRNRDEERAFNGAAFIRDMLNMLDDPTLSLSDESGAFSFDIDSLVMGLARGTEHEKRRAPGTR